MSDTSKAIEKIYLERSNFILIGLTGRTGSGCSTVANILTKDKNCIEKSSQTEFSFGNIEERKNKIVFNYILNKWQAFYKISVTDILTLFIIDYSIDKTNNFIFDEFNKFINKNRNEQQISSISERKNKFKQELQDISYESILETRELYKKKLKELGLLQEKLEKNKFEQLIQDIYSFYFDELCKFSQKFKDAIDKIYPEMKYLVIYQVIGDNVRSSGKAFDGNFNSNSIYKLSKLINKFIKLIKRKADIDHNHTLIVIDALRNPFEAFFFKDRYSAFYLISVNTDDEERMGRLQKKMNINFSQMIEIDRKEYKNKLKEENIFISQNIQKCIEISDIHLTNPTFYDENYSFLTQQLFRYLALIIHPGLVMPTPIERCMQIAYSAKLNSGCISRQVGAVITDTNYSIKAVGWNDTASGQVPCLLRSVENLLKFDDTKAFSDYENSDETFRKVMRDKYKDIDHQKLDGRNISFCFKDIQNYIEGEKNQIHTRSLHAEENAFLQITKYGGEGIEGGILFTTASPCELCSKKAYQLGIKEIIYIDPYPGIANKHILKIGDSSIRPDLKLFHGAIGNAYHKLYQPVLSFKDELNWIANIELNNNNDDDYDALINENDRLKTRVQELEKKVQELESST